MSLADGARCCCATRALGSESFHSSPSSTTKSNVINVKEMVKYARALDSFAPHCVLWRWHKTPRVPGAKFLTYYRHGVVVLGYKANNDTTSSRVLVIYLYIVSFMCFMCSWCMLCVWCMLLRQVTICGWWLRRRYEVICHLLCATKNASSALVFDCFEIYTYFVVNGSDDLERYIQGCGGGGGERRGERLSKWWSLTEQLYRCMSVHLTLKIRLFRVLFYV